VKRQLTAQQLLEGFADVPRIEVSQIGILDALVETKLASSKSEARRFVESGGVVVNNQKVDAIDFILIKEDAKEHRFSLIRRGKKQYAIIMFD